MFSHVLVPVDGSANALAALDKAVELVGLTRGRLSILTIYRHHSMLEASFSMVRREAPGPLDDSLRDYARDVAEHAKQRAVDQGADSVRAFVKNGPVARGIVSFAKENEVDLIAMGGRGFGSVENYLLGSVSHKVTGTAKCPVLIV